MRWTLALGSLLAGCATPAVTHARSGVRSTLADLRGHAVVVSFWLDTCPPCLDQLPAVMDAVAARGDAVVFLPVFNREERGSELDAWLAKQPDWFQSQVCWGDHAFLAQYDRTRVPRTYVYGRNGHLVDQFDGKLEGSRIALFQASLDRALATAR